MLDSLEKKKKKNLKSLDIYYHYLSAITQGYREMRIDFEYSFIQTGFDLLLYEQGNFRDTPVSKYVCQSQTLTHPFKTLLSQSFTPELFTAPLGPFDLLSSNLSFQFNYQTLPLCLPVTYHVEQLRV